MITEILLDVGGTVSEPYHSSSTLYILYSHLRGALNKYYKLFAWRIINTIAICVVRFGDRTSYYTNRDGRCRECIPCPLHHPGKHHIC